MKAAVAVVWPSSLTTLLVLLALALLPNLWLFGITELTEWLSGWQPFWDCYPAGGSC